MTSARSLSEQRLYTPPPPPPLREGGVKKPLSQSERICSLNNYFQEVVVYRISLPGLNVRNHRMIMSRNVRLTAALDVSWVQVETKAHAIVLDVLICHMSDIWMNLLHDAHAAQCTLAYVQMLQGACSKETLLRRRRRVATRAFSGLRSSALLVSGAMSILQSRASGLQSTMQGNSIPTKTNPPSQTRNTN